MAIVSWCVHQTPYLAKQSTNTSGTSHTMIEFIRIYHSATSAPPYTRCVCVPTTLKALDIQLFWAQLLTGYSFVTQE